MRGCEGGAFEGVMGGARKSFERQSTVEAITAERNRVGTDDTAILLLVLEIVGALMNKPNEPIILNPKVTPAAVFRNPD